MDRARTPFRPQGRSILATLALVAWSMPLSGVAAGEAAPGGGPAAALTVCKAPPGWEIADPFTDQTPYWPEFAWIGPIRKADGDTSRRVLLRSATDDQSQIFLVRGPAAYWEPRLEKATKDMQATPGEGFRKGTEKTADGVTVDFHLGRMPPGVIAGRDATYLLGVARVGEDVLLVDAGGATSSFDPDLARMCIGSLRLDGKATTRPALRTSASPQRASGAAAPAGVSPASPEPSTPGSSGTAPAITPGQVLTGEDMQRLIEQRKGMIERPTPLGEEIDHRPR